MTLIVIQLLPAGECQAPCGDSLEQRRLARVVRTCDDNVARQNELHVVEALESFDEHPSDHGLHRISPQGIASATRSSLPRSSMTFTATCFCSPASNGALR